VAEGHRSEREGERPAAGSSSEKVASGLVVERITHQDVPAVCALLKKIWESEPTGLPVPLLKTWQPTPLEFTSWMEGVTYFAGRREGRVVGVVGCELKNGSCHLVHLAVDPESRRQGVATALLAAALDWAKRSNAPEVWADALARFTAAAALFKHLGFAECGHLHKHQWNEDVRLFEWLL
jgi:GNAT superfamily N-acetyltransferase